ncbi:MAG: hemolysin family protein [Actinobacteria bacterium]|nr:hemolysin family protein [Actinomycetota bacterium]
MMVSIYAATRGFQSDDGILIALIIVLFLLTAMLAVAETSLVRMSRAKAASLEEEGRRGARHLRRLVERPESFLNPVLLLVLMCQLLAATLVGVVSDQLFGALGVVAATAFEVIVVFVFIEAAPKTWAIKYPDRAALLTAPIVDWIVHFPPIRAVSSVLVGLVNILLPGDSKQRQADVTESELLALTDMAMQEEVIEHEERALIHSVIDFGDTVVREVMVPRPDIVAAEAEDPVGAVLDAATAAGFSRLPVHEGNLDDVVGVAYMKDLVRAEREGRAGLPVRDFVKAAHFVPETKRVASLMREMQAEKFHLALVVDEYGSISGLVTLEDLIEELVGEIVDEFDVEEPAVEALPGGGFRVKGQLVIDEANEQLKADLPSGEWDTVGGLVLNLLGHVPVEGESVSVGGLRLVVERVRRRRIERVRVIPETDGSESSSSAFGDKAEAASAPPALPAPVAESRVRDTRSGSRRHSSGHG